MRHVLITRPAGQADELRRRLAERNVASTSVPTVAIEPAGTDAELAQAVATLGAANGRPAASWLILTSANGAHALADCLRRDHLSLPAGVSVAAVGPATAAALRDEGIPVHHVPDDYLTVAIAAGLGDVRGQRVVLARADLATEDLALVLAGRGALVEEVVAYRTVEGPPESREPLRRALARKLDGIAFTSGSTARGLVALLETPERHRASRLPSFCIGPVTAAEVRRLGFEPTVVADEHTAAGLANAVADYFAAGGPR